jgi:nicotinamidase/pyrazinamidase
MRTALLIIDVQNDFCPPNGSLAVKEGDQIIDPINSLKASGKFDLVVYSQDWHPKNHISFAINHPNASPFILKDVPAAENSSEMISQMLWPAHCIQNSSGAQFHPKLTPPNDQDVIIYKGTNPFVDSYSGFFDNMKKVQTNMDSILRKHNIQRVVVVGLALDYCVSYTALDAADLGYETIVPIHLSKSVSLQSEESMLAQMKNNPGIILVENTEQLLSILSK